MAQLLKLIKLLLLNNLYCFISLLISFGFCESKSQNLIRNGSFESYTVNPSGCASNFSMVNGWGQINSPDHFNAFCSQNNSFGVPNNSFGALYPKNGNAYIGIATYYKTLEVKEYFFQHLSSALVLGKSYYVSFYISRGDRSGYSIKNIGAYFSVAQPTTVANAYISAIPQVKNQSGFLSDTTGWTKIEGYFTAQGGEEYITIGNFNSNADTDTLYSGTTNPIPFDNGMAYYYIDSVSLYDALNIPTGISELKNEVRINLYPNPNNGTMILKYDLGNASDVTMNLHDVTGKLITAYKLQSTKGTLQMNEQTLQNGIYFYYILVGGQSIKTDKIVIIK